MTAHFYLTRRKSRKIPGSLMLIRCLSCETGAQFVSIAALNLKTVRILRLVRQEASPETPLSCLITRRSQVQVLSPQPQEESPVSIVAERIQGFSLFDFKRVWSLLGRYSPAFG